MPQLLFPSSKPIGLTPKKQRKLGYSTITLDGRKFHIEQINSHKWEGWFDDDHSCTYEGKTKQEMLEDAGC